MSTFNTRFAAAIKSYKNNGESLKSLVIEAIDYADTSGSHNPVYINKILDAMENSDLDHMTIIVKAFAPFKIKDGVAKVHHAGNARAYQVDRAMVKANKSFRALSEALVPAKAKKIWDLDKAAMAYARACRAANQTDDAAHAAVTRAHKAIDAAAVEKALKAAA